MTWFRQLTGFEESPPDVLREKLHVHEEALRSRVNDKAYCCGRLEMPSLAKLRARVTDANACDGGISVREVVANVQDLHCDPANSGALFQVASQFNLLEMVSPSVTPEDGVGIYEHDRTQGPACAIACGAGTIYRNYFVPVNGQIGQTATNQIDCLADIGDRLGNENGRLWQMKNGYALPSRKGISQIAKMLQSSSESQLDELRKLLRIGLHWNTQVTLKNCQHTVTQAYCSALPVAYSPHLPSVWEPFARLVLEAAYEATLCAGILNAKTNGNQSVYLTLLGGGAFGNMTEWIVDAIRRALELHRNIDLDVAIVSYGSSRDFVCNLANEYSA